ncbi:MAG: family 43 glycosylhydrolase [Bryobacteraceae bacterium]
MLPVLNLAGSGIAILCAVAGLARAQVTVETSVNFRLVNKGSGLVLGIQSASRAAGAAAQQSPDTADADHLWHFLPAGNNWYKIVNAYSAEVLGVADGPVVQCADNGAADRLWEVIDAGGGYSRIRNVNSGLLLGIPNPTGKSGKAALAAGDDVAGALWRLLPAGPAYPDPLPVTGDTLVHDPSVVKAANGTYYLFGTHGGIRMQSSPDRTYFVRTSPALSAIPSWVSTYNKGDLWAPDVSYRDGKYWLYYAASTFGKNVSAIGLATSLTAAPGDWVDQGVVCRSQSDEDYNAIDPGLIVDRSGGWWLSFGSFWGGIQMIQIDPATGKQTSKNNTRYPLARRTATPAIEAAYIYSHGEYYYLFVSFDRCCVGIRSTYHIAVGRSSSVTGPYYDRGGVAMSDGGGTIVLSTHGHVVGPGGQMVMHETDGDLLIYHYYDGNSNGRPMLGMNHIVWDSEGWPRIN